MRLSVHIIEGVCLIGGLLIRGFTVQSFFFSFLNNLIACQLLTFQFDVILLQVHSVAKTLSKHTNIQVCLATG